MASTTRWLIHAESRNVYISSTCVFVRANANTGSLNMFALILLSATLTFHGCLTHEAASSTRDVNATIPLQAEPLAVHALTLPVVYPINTTYNVTLMKPLPECNGKKVGVYVWGHQHWNSPNSTFMLHLTGANARKFTCGDIFINVADYSSAESISGRGFLLPFLINARRAGNRAVIWLTYGDIAKRDVVACRKFVDTFYEWLLSIPVEWLDVIKPIGLSFDIEHFPNGAIEEILIYAQRRKNEVSPKLLPDGFFIQCMIEGQPKPLDTDIVMRHADRALMMAYRNYLTKPTDPTGMDNGMMRRLQYMFKDQCTRCLDDEYAVRNYKAKITIMVETSCNLGASCGYVSFCAADANRPAGGVEYLVDHLDQIDSKLVSSGLMTKDQRNRLISSTSPFAVHDWDWFQCFYQDSNDTNHLCKNYSTYAAACRAQ